MSTPDVLDLLDSMDEREGWRRENDRLRLELRDVTAERDRLKQENDDLRGVIARVAASALGVGTA